MSTEFIHSAVMRGGLVVVNCYMGLSRSATCVLAYLMAKHSITLDKVKKRINTSLLATEALSLLLPKANKSYSSQSKNMFPLVIWTLPSLFIKRNIATLGSILDSQLS